MLLKIRKVEILLKKNTVILLKLLQNIQANFLVIYSHLQGHNASKKKFLYHDTIQ